MRRFGFTLAEVLVTLGIIGVVAALTMPQMTVRTQNMQLETATLKYYSQIQEAAQRYMVQNGLDELDASFDGSKFVEDNFKTALTCAVTNDSPGTVPSPRPPLNPPLVTYESLIMGPVYAAGSSSPSDCFAAAYKDLSGEEQTLVDNSVTAYILNGGASIQIASGENPTITIDVNGVKGPNIVNRDLWQLSLRNDGMVEDIIQGKTPEEIDSNLDGCIATDSLSGCFAGFVKNGFKFPY